MDSHLGKLISVFVSPRYCSTNFYRDTVLITHNGKDIGKAIYVQKRNGEYFVVRHLVYQCMTSAFSFVLQSSLQK